MFGYIREKENELILHNIPSIISYISLMYYFHGEHFDKHGQYLKSSPDKMTITNIQKTRMDLSCNWKNVAIGRTSINSMSKCMIKWTFKINSVNENQRNCGNVIFYLLSSPLEFELKGNERKIKHPWYNVNPNGSTTKSTHAAEICYGTFCVGIL